VDSSSPVVRRTPTPCRRPASGSTGKRCDFTGVFRTGPWVDWQTWWKRWPRSGRWRGSPFTPRRQGHCSVGRKRSGLSGEAFEPSGTGAEARQRIGERLRARLPLPVLSARDGNARSAQPPAECRQPVSR
jgi:hypothetical protein